MKILLSSLLICVIFWGCEKEEDPAVRVKNSLDEYIVEMKLINTSSGHITSFNDISAGETTDFKKISAGPYRAITDNITFDFTASKNKKYTLEIYFTGKIIAIKLI